MNKIALALIISAFAVPTFAEDKGELRVKGQEMRQEHKIKKGELKEKHHAVKDEMKAELDEIMKLKEQGKMVEFHRSMADFYEKKEKVKSDLKNERIKTREEIQSKRDEYKNEVQSKREAKKAEMMQKREQKGNKNQIEE